MSRSSALETMAPVLKGRARELPEPPTAPSGEMYEAILYPNRSLPAGGFLAVMAVVIGANLTMGVWFYALGAWPVIGFCGLDVFLVWLAFRLSYRQGRLHERVRITEGSMWVARVLPSGHETRWKLLPHWTRVDIDRPIEHESQVRLTSKGQTLVLGSFLSPEERGAFADALAKALARFRA
jgi:uncharacterized membrane protein